MNNEVDDIVNVFRSFLLAMDKWEQAAYHGLELEHDKRKADPTGDHRPLREVVRGWVPMLHDTMKPYCTEEAIQRIQEIDSLGSPSTYGPNGYAIVECAVKGEKAKLTTRGCNKVPESDTQDIFLFVKVDGQWKIDGKKQVTDSGRQRKVDLF